MGVGEDLLDDLLEDLLDGGCAVSATAAAAAIKAALGGNGSTTYEEEGKAGWLLNGDDDGRSAYVEAGEGGVLSP